MEVAKRIVRSASNPHPLTISTGSSRLSLSLPTLNAIDLSLEKKWSDDRTKAIHSKYVSAVVAV